MTELETVVAGFKVLRAMMAEIHVEVDELFARVAVLERKQAATEGDGR